MATAKPEGAYDPTKRSWELGHEPFAAQLRTTYRDDMVEKRGKQAAMSKEAKADLRAVHFEYGSAPVCSTVAAKTSMQDAFRGLPGGPQGLPTETMADLRASHFRTGYSADKSKMYTTTARELNGQPGPPAKLSAAVKADLRKSHFDVGMRDAQWKSLAKSDFESRPGVTSDIRPASMDMPEETMKDLRAVHFQYGYEDKGAYTTESSSVSTRSSGAASCFPCGCSVCVSSTDVDRCCRW